MESCGAKMPNKAFLPDSHGKQYLEMSLNKIRAVLEPYVTFEQNEL
jgi:hypothetical protein